MGQSFTNICFVRLHLVVGILISTYQCLVFGIFIILILSFCFQYSSFKILLIKYLDFSCFISTFHLSIFVFCIPFQDMNFRSIILYSTFPLFFCYSSLKFSLSLLAFFCIPVSKFSSTTSNS